VPAVGCLNAAVQVVVDTAGGDGGVATADHLDALVLCPRDLRIDDHRVVIRAPGRAGAITDAEGVAVGHRPAPNHALLDTVALGIRPDDRERVHRGGALGAEELEPAQDVVAAVDTQEVARARAVHQHDAAPLAALVQCVDRDARSGETAGGLLAVDAGVDVARLRRPAPEADRHLGRAASAWEDGRIERHQGTRIRTGRREAGRHVSLDRKSSLPGSCTTKVRGKIVQATTLDTPGPPATTTDR